MCYFFIKETFEILQFSANFAKFYLSQLYNFILSDEIETFEFETEVFTKFFLSCFSKIMKKHFQRPSTGSHFLEGVAGNKAVTFLGGFAVFTF